MNHPHSRLAVVLATLLLATTAAADDDKDDVEFALDCSYTCGAGGYDIHVYQHPNLNQYILTLMPSPVVTYSDWAGASSNATYLGTQNISGSAYSDLYCDTSGLYISGAVYENQSSSQVNSHVTGILHGYSPCTAGGDINDALSELAIYTQSPSWAEVPDFCVDLGCAGPDSGFIDHSDPMDDYEWYDEADPCEFWVPEMGCLDDQLEGSGGSYDPHSSAGKPEDLCWDPGLHRYVPCESALGVEDSLSSTGDTSGSTKPTRDAKRR